MVALQKSFVWQFLDGKHDSIIVLLSETVSRLETQFLRFSIYIIAGVAGFFLEKCKTMF